MNKKLFGTLSLSLCMLFSCTTTVKPDGLFQTIDAKVISVKNDVEDQIDKSSTVESANSINLSNDLKKRASSPSSSIQYYIEVKNTSDYVVKEFSFQFDIQDENSNIVNDEKVEVTIPFYGDYFLPQSTRRFDDDFYTYGSYSFSRLHTYSLVNIEYVGDVQIAKNAVVYSTDNGKIQIKRKEVYSLGAEENGDYLYRIEYQVEEIEEIEIDKLQCSVSCAGVRGRFYPTLDYQNSVSYPGGSLYVVFEEAVEENKIDLLFTALDYDYEDEKNDLVDSVNLGFTITLISVISLLSVSLIVFIVLLAVDINKKKKEK